MNTGGKSHSLWLRFLKNKKDLAVRDKIALEYYFLVDGESRRLLSRLPLNAYLEKKEDLVSAGVIGLLQAIDRFIPPKKKC